MTVGHFASGQAKMGNHGMQRNFAGRFFWYPMCANFASRPVAWHRGHFGLRDQ